MSMPTPLMVNTPEPNVALPLTAGDPMFAMAHGDGRT